MKKWQVDYEKETKSLVKNNQINPEDRPYAEFVMRFLNEGSKKAREWGRTMAVDAYGNLRKNGFIEGRKLRGDASPMGFLLMVLGARDMIKQTVKENKAR